MEPFVRMVNRLIEFRSWYDSDVTCWRVVRPPPYDPLATEVFQIADRHQKCCHRVWLSGCVGRGDVLAAQEAVSRYTGTLNAYGTNRDKANGLT